MKKKYLLLLAGALALVGAAVVVGLKEKEKSRYGNPDYVFTYAENQAEDYPTTKGAYRFAQLVQERTGGKVMIQIYADAKLGDEVSVMDQLRFGGIDFARISLSTVADVVPEIAVLQLPYIYDSSDHMWKVLDGEIGDELLNAFEGYDFLGLSWYDAGARSFYTTKKPIERLEDLAGLQIRVPESQMLEDTITALGAEPVPMAFDQVYSSLEMGTSDGAENNWPSYDSTRHYEVAKYMTLDEHSRIPEVQLISRATWNKLPQEYREIIQECAVESAKYERHLWKLQERISREHVCANGCVVTELSAGEKARFRAAMEPVYEKYCFGQMDIVNAIRNMGKE